MKLDVARRAFSAITGTTQRYVKAQQRMKKLAMKKLAIVIALAIAGFVFMRFDLADQLTIENLKAQQQLVDSQYQAAPLLVVSIFMAVYIAVTAASLPGAAILTLAAGAFFGVVLGTAIVSVASTVGATLAFLASRHLLRDWVQSRFGDRLKALNHGVERDGAFYLLSLRLVPVFPFFLVNLLMGLTPIKTMTYFWVSQAGMLLGTAVYVNAGTQIARIDAFNDIASPALLASFAALGVLPWIGKWIVSAMRKERSN